MPTDPKPVMIPTAGFHSLYDINDVMRALESGGNKHEDLSAFHERMIGSGGERFLISPSDPSCIDGIDDLCPNFHTVSEDIRRAVMLAIGGNEPVDFPPILLLGEPGIGKTHYAEELAKHLGTGYGFVPMGSMTAGWILSGASAQWKDARPGKIAKTLIEGLYANPVIVVDEIDKANRGTTYDPLGPLYELLEGGTAKRFCDEYVGSDIPLDASRIQWVLTANDTVTIPEPLLNRMTLYEIKRPSREAAIRIAQTLYREILAKHNWHFHDEASDSVTEKLSLLQPRTMRQVLMRAFGIARAAARDYLVPEDIQPPESGKNRIGF